MKDMTIHEESFIRTAPIFDPKAPKTAPTEPILNPQTVNLCDTLGIDDPVQVLLARTGRTMKKPSDYKSDSLPVEVVTPLANGIKCSKLSLPAPITPSEDNVELLSQESTSSGSISLTDSFNTTNVCSTPVLACKKTFKRRNVSIYNMTNQDESESTASTVVDSESSPCKLPLKSSIL